MPMQRKKSDDPALSREQLKRQGTDVQSLANQTESQYQLGDRTIDVLAEMAAKGELTKSQLREILMAKASLPETMPKS